MTSQAPGYYSGAGHQLKLTSYNTSTSADGGGGGQAVALSDKDHYKSWRHNVHLAACDDVNMTSPTTGVCYYDDDDRRQYVEHIYESPKFDKRHVS